MAAGVDGLEHVSFMTADGVDPIPTTCSPHRAHPVTVGMTLGLAPHPAPAPPPGMVARLPALIANVRGCTAAARR